MVVVNGYGINDLKKLAVWQYLGNKMQVAIESQMPDMDSQAAEKLIKGILSLEETQQEIVSQYGEATFQLFLERVLADMADDIAHRAKKLKGDFREFYENVERHHELADAEVVLSKNLK